MMGMRAVAPRYCLVEINENGHTMSEEFDAPDDNEARLRCEEVCEGRRFELWRGPTLIATGGSD